MSLYPLPAILFLSSLVGLLIVLALVYFLVLKKKDLCGSMEGHAGDEEEGEKTAANGEAGPGTSGELPAENAYEVNGGKPAAGSTANIAGGDLVDAPPAKDSALNAIVTSVATAINVEGLAATPGGSGGGDEGGGGEGGGGTAEGEIIPPDEPEPLAIGGKILVQFTYMPAANKINLTVIRAGEMPPPERGGSENIQVHLCILPQRKQRFRTKAVSTAKGVFNETFQFIHMTKDVVENCAIRLRVYGAQRFSKRIIGETRMSLSQIDLTSALADEQIWKTLSPKGLVAIYHNIDEEDEPDIDDW